MTFDRVENVIIEERKRKDSLYVFKRGRVESTSQELDIVGCSTMTAAKVKWEVVNTVLMDDDKDLSSTKISLMRIGAVREVVIGVPF